MNTLMNRLTRKTEELAKRDDGVGAIEFALLSPLLMLVVMGSIELGLITLANSVLETATVNAARSGKSSGNQGFISDEVKRIGGGLLKSSNVIFTAQPSAIRSDGGQLFNYRSTYRWKLFTPLMANFFGDRRGNYNIIVNVPAVVEPS